MTKKYIVFGFLISSLCLSLDVQATDTFLSNSQNQSSGREDAFFMFDVGQGNCQFAYFSQYKKGFLYDCGSSAQRVPYKIDALRKNNEFKIIFQRKINQKKEDTEYQDESFCFGQIDGLSPSYETKQEKRQSKEMSGSKENDSFQDVSLQGFIKKTITSYTLENGLKHLYVVASHPDEDHINWIPGVIPENVSVTAFLEGDWLRKGNKKDNGLSTPVSKVLSYLLTRKDTVVKMPYYWNGISYFGEKYEYASIMNMLNNELEKDPVNSKFSETYKILKFFKVDTKENIKYQGFLSLQDSLQVSLEDSLQVSLQDSPQEINYQQPLGFNQRAKRIPDRSSDTSLSKMKKTFKTDKQENSSKSSMLSFLECKFDFYKRTDDPNLLTLEDDLIFIDHMLFPFGDPNAQSAIVYVKMPSLNMDFILTGDGNEHTFNMHLRLDNNKYFYEKHFENNTEIKLLMMPHHGSRENDPSCLIEIIKPHMIGISAGNGQYGHPSRALLHEVDKQWKKWCVNEQLIFQKNFDQEGIKNIDLIYFETKIEKDKKTKKEKTVYIPYLRYGEAQELPFLCTNVLGHVRFGEKGIDALFSSFISNQDRTLTFYVEYADRTKKIINHEVLEELEDFENIFSSNRIDFFFKIKTKGNTDVFYDAFPLGKNIHSMDEDYYEEDQD